MKKWLFILLVNAYWVQAQNQNNNWFFGTYLGMNFSNNIMTPIPDNTSIMYSPAASSSLSDNATGNLLFYTNGTTVFNKAHTAMPNGQLKTSPYVSNCMVVKGSNKKHLIFYTNENNIIYYAMVDMSLNNGFGDVVYKDSLLGTNMDLQFTAVRLPNNQGHWLVTHKKGDNRFFSYKIVDCTINKTPVISIAGQPTYSNTQYLYGKLITNRRGDKLAYIFSNSDINSADPCIVQEFSIDKKCGTITLSKSVFDFLGGIYAKSGYVCYDSSGRFLYVSYYTSSDLFFLCQYDMNTANPGSSRVIIANSHESIGDLQIGSNGKIYLAGSENRTFTSKISVINKPWLQGANCDFKQNSIQLSKQPFLGSIGTEHFPNFVLDVSNQFQYTSTPQLNITPACVLTQSTFQLKDSTDLLYDSMFWDFGDGNTHDKIATTYTYQTAGKYIVSFNWFVCNTKFSLVDTIKVGEKPTINLEKDTTLCFGTKITLTATPNADTYKWSTGDTTPFIQVNKPGNYSVKVSNGGCYDEDTIQIDYYPSLFTALGDEYFICDREKELVKLDAGEKFTHYKWTPTDDTTQWIIVGTVGEYFVVVKDFRGCDGSDGTLVKRKCPVSLYLPNAFTPNGDGLNDTYAPIASDVETFHMNIYNRWGELVFTTNTMSKQWDGTVNAKLAQSDVYIYEVKYSGYINKKIQHFETKGNLTLLR